MIDGTSVAIGVSIVSVIVWLVRLEARANQSAKDLTILQESFHAHEADKTIHHNADAFAEFEKRIDLRFTHLSDGLKKVEAYVEDIDKKIERYLNEQ